MVRGGVECRGGMGCFRFGGEERYRAIPASDKDCGGGLRRSIAHLSADAFASSIEKPWRNVRVLLARITALQRPAKVGTGSGETVARRTTAIRCSST